MQYTEEELQKILDDHKLWHLGEGGKRANLSKINLSHADLTNADLSGANLVCANLFGSNLTNANLFGSDLSEANLRCADLSNADLTNVKLFGADLTTANLSYANLSNASLLNASLRFADLSGADLSYADLSVVVLSRANLTNAKFKNTLIFGERVNKAPVQLYHLPYSVLITDTMMRIGCKIHSIDAWLAFTVEKIEKMDGDNAKKFYEQYGDLVKSAVLSHRVLKEENKES